MAVHNQDNREHDIFDSDDYYQFHGGMIATVRSLTGRQPKAYFGDSSRPDAARVRDLREEALRVYRSRVVNPKWLESIRRHGYKGGLELTATVDYIFGFDATAHVAPDLVYEGLAAEYALSPEMQRSSSNRTRGRCTRSRIGCSRPPTEACGSARRRRRSTRCARCG